MVSPAAGSTVGGWSPRDHRGSVAGEDVWARRAERLDSFHGPGGEADLGRCLVDGAWRLLVGRFEEAVLADLFEVYAVVDDALASLPPS